MAVNSALWTWLLRQWALLSELVAPSGTVGRGQRWGEDRCFLPRQWHSACCAVSAARSRTLWQLHVWVLLSVPLLFLELRLFWVLQNGLEDQSEWQALNDVLRCPSMLRLMGFCLGNVHYASFFLSWACMTQETSKASANKLLVVISQSLNMPRLIWPHRHCSLIKHNKIERQSVV